MTVVHNKIAQRRSLKNVNSQAPPCWTLFVYTEQKYLININFESM